MNGFSDDQILHSWRISCTRKYGVYIDTWSDQPYLPIPAVKLVNRLVTQSQSLRLWNTANGMNCRFTFAKALPLTHTSPTLTLTAHIVLSYPSTKPIYSIHLSNRHGGPRLLLKATTSTSKGDSPKNGPSTALQAISEHRCTKEIFLVNGDDLRLYARGLAKTSHAGAQISAQGERKVIKWRGGESSAILEDSTGYVNFGAYALCC